MGRKQVASIRASSRLRKTTAIHLLVSTLALWIVWQVLPQTSVAQTFSYIHPLALNSNTLAPFRTVGRHIGRIHTNTINAGILQSFGYTGGGTLLLQKRGNALQASTFAGGAGALVFDRPVSGNVFTFGDLSGVTKNTLQNSAGWASATLALTVGGNNANTNYSSVLSGAGSLTKFGAGTLTLSGANTYTGSTTVSSGTLSLSDSTSTWGIDTIDGGYMDLTAFAKVDAGTLTLSVTNNFIDGGGTIINSGTLTLITSKPNNTYSTGEILPHSGVVLVPEPATAALLASGGLLLGGFALWRRRRVPLLACKQ